MKPGSVFRRQNLLFALCLLFSAMGWGIVFADDTLLFHNLYLQPIAGAFLFFAVCGREKKLPFLLMAVLSIPGGIFLLTVFFESVMELYLYLVLGIPCVILLLVGCGITALILYAVGKLPPAPKSGRIAAGAAALQLRYKPLVDALFSEVNPIPAKAAMAAMGMCGDTARLPLTPMEDAARANLLRQMEAVGIEV